MFGDEGEFEVNVCEYVLDVKVEFVYVKWMRGGGEVGG